MEYLMSTAAIAYGNQSIPYRINVDTRRTTKVAIHVYPDGAVVVDAPPDFNTFQVQTAVQKRARWVMKHVDEAKARFAHVRTREYVSGEQIMYLGRRYVLKVISVSENPKPVRLKGNRLEVETRTATSNDVKDRVRAWYRAKAKDYFAKKTADLAARLPWVNETPPVRILSMAKQWGSCSPTGRIILNPHLIKAPRECIEYVISHELAHLKHHDHGSEFWSLIDSCSPGWEHSKKQLDGLVEVLTTE